MASSPPDEDWKTYQLQYNRVKQAYSEYQPLIKEVMACHGIDSHALEIYIRVFKYEQMLELWGKNQLDTAYQLLRVFPFCSTVGNLGPKRRQGDLQIPEGIYEIDRYNPFSKYYLGMHVNYPNKLDSLIGKRPYGGQIFIHGGCESIGCIPLTDSGIKELYIWTLLASAQVQKKIPLHIYPARLETAKYQKIVKIYGDPRLSKFWGTLRPSYLYFEQYKRPAGSLVNEKSRIYQFYPVGPQGY